jgi:hypothetical protein
MIARAKRMQSVRASWSRFLGVLASFAASERNNGMLTAAPQLAMTSK